MQTTDIYISELSTAGQACSAAISIKPKTASYTTQEDTPLSSPSATPPTALAQASLHGLAGISASEQSKQWSGQIDMDGENTPLPSFAFKYVSAEGMIRWDGDLPRVMRLEPLPRDLLYNCITDATGSRTLIRRTEGTYPITSGFGALGLKVARWRGPGAREAILPSPFSTGRPAGPGSA
ncbi:hypothetical protein GGR56DRAFT_247641 [Xylariaceae sp. FL0804]|nr:hypothetical protein GGR56DRAFT_247641 [Xylariaceae sp. FL0804]